MYVGTYIIILYILDVVQDAFSQPPNLPKALVWQATAEDGEPSPAAVAALTQAS